VLLEHVTKKYGETVAVNDLNIEIKDKEFLVLVGPSGCGKSTALRMIAGLEEITSGYLYIGEEVVNDVAPKDRDIAMVFQSYALYPHMSVYDNMAFGLRLLKHLPFLEDTEHGKANGNAAGDPMGRRRSREAAIRRQVEQVADGIGLREYLNRKPSQLSGGQRQRVALGRAIVRQPKVFLMDEPLSNLDAKMRISTRAELQKLHRRLGITTIYVTHDQVEAMTMGDRIAVMRDGILQQLDTPSNLYKHPVNVFVAGFIGSPAMNIFSMDVEEDGGELFVKGHGIRMRVPESYAARLADHKGKQILFGIRPEGIYDARFRRDADPTTYFEAAVDVVEPQGRDLYIYVTAGEQPLVVRVDDRTDVQPQQPIRLALDPEAIYAFDPDTNNALL
jgi:multiple sugar transport system ATP-binding protein